MSQRMEIHVTDAHGGVECNVETQTHSPECQYPNYYILSCADPNALGEWSCLHRMSLSAEVPEEKELIEGILRLAAGSGAGGSPGT